MASRSGGRYPQIVRELGSALPVDIAFVGIGDKWSFGI